MVVAKKIVIANWKMSPPTPSEACANIEGARKIARRLSQTRLVICPPFIYLALLAEKYFSRVQKITLGAQDCFWEQKGAYTGEVSAEQIANLGGKVVIVGHSERRALEDDNSVVAKKLTAALQNGLEAVLCIGELTRDVEGNYLNFIKEQLLSALVDVKKTALGKIMIAYEPVWAIGGDALCSIAPRDLHEMTIFVRKILREHYKSDMVFGIPILYGGSVSPENTALLVKDGNIQGILVGHKSLDIQAFETILKIVDKI